MDSLTHVVIGAALGEVFAGKQLGKRAMLLGAIAHSMPDVDVVTALWMSPAQGFLAHRGFTHSLLFAALVTPLFAWLLHYWHHGRDMSLMRWVLFLGTAFFLHPLLDSLNAYGTGLLIPFSSTRVSLNILFVADPFFSVWPGIAALSLLAMNRFHTSRRKIAMSGLALCLVYIAYACINKVIVDRVAERTFAVRGIHPTEYFTTPTPLNTWLWYVAAKTPDGYFLGYRSVFDSGKMMELSYHPRNQGLIDSLTVHESIADLIKFARGYYTIDAEGKTLVFNDLWFGQRDGWRDDKSPFVFRFFLERSARNYLIVQKGRFGGWNPDMGKAFVARIAGKQ